MSQVNNLSNLKFGDLDNAKSATADFSVCPAGSHVAKVMSFTENDNYNFVTLEIEGKSYNFFYDYTLRNSDDLDYNVINWIAGLAMIPVTKETSLLAITNSAIGHSYEIETYVYVGKNGKNKDKEQHAIRFNVKPVPVTVQVQEENLELPF